MNTLHTYEPVIPPDEELRPSEEEAGRLFSNLRMAFAIGQLTQKQFWEMVATLEDGGLEDLVHALESSRDFLKNWQQLVSLVIEKANDSPEGNGPIN